MPDYYPLSMRVLHWLIAVLILGLLALGLYMEDLPREDPSRGLLYTIHKATGFIVLFLVAWRLVTRLKSTLPPLPAGIPAWEGHFANWTHKGIYLFMFAMPLSGLWMSNAYGHGVDMYGLFTIPPLFPESEKLGGLAHTVHEYGANVLMVLLLFHFAGVIKHRYFDLHDVLHRMTGGKPPQA